VQLTPFPVKPGLHVHVKLPTLFSHIALTSQLEVIVEHSSMSAKEILEHNLKYAVFFPQFLLSIVLIYILMKNVKESQLFFYYPHNKLVTLNTTSETKHNLNLNFFSERIGLKLDNISRATEKKTLQIFFF
jgi:hypothetical protein